MNQRERTYWYLFARGLMLDVEEGSMKNLGLKAGVSVAVSAAAASTALAAFVSYAYPWPTVAGAIVACVAVVWVAKMSVRTPRAMSDVIGDVESEAPLLGARAPARGRVSAKTTP